MRKNFLVSSAILALVLFSGCQNSSKKLQKSLVEDSIPALTTNNTIGTSDENLTKEYEKAEKKRGDIIDRIDGYDNYNQAEFLIVEAPKHGDLKIYKNGIYQYTPYSDFNGSDSFSYKVKGSSCPAKRVDISSDMSINKPSNKVTNLKIEQSYCENRLRVTWDDNSDDEKNFIIFINGKPFDIVDMDSKEYILDTTLLDEYVDAKESRALDTTPRYSIAVVSQDEFGIRAFEITYIYFEIIDGKLYRRENSIIIDRF